MWYEHCENFTRVNEIFIQEKDRMKKILFNIYFWINYPRTFLKLLSIDNCHSVDSIYFKLETLVLNLTLKTHEKKKF